MKTYVYLTLLILASTCNLVSSLTFRPTLCSRWAEGHDCPKNKVLKEDCEWCYPGQEYFRKKDRCKRRCCVKSNVNDDMGFFCVANPDIIKKNSVSDAWCHDNCLDGEEKEYCSYNADASVSPGPYFTVLVPDDIEHDTGPCRLSDGSAGKDGVDYTLFARENLEECRLRCLGDDSCLAYEAKVNAEHNRCEIWHVLPAYAKTDADTYTCDVKHSQPICNCQETPKVVYTCEALVQPEGDDSITNEQCQTICTTNYNHEQCLYAGFFPQSSSQVCSCVTDFKCTVLDYLKPNHICEGRTAVDHELGTIFDKDCLQMNLVMAGCGIGSDAFNPYQWVVKKADDPTIDDLRIIPRWSSDMDPYCLKTCLRSSFHENAYFDFLFIMPTGHEECYYKTRNQYDGGDWDDFYSDWDGKLLMAKNHLNARNNYVIQYIEEGDFKTEPDSVTNCAVFGVPFSDGEE
eukprot:Awhi_evm1s3483